jgi:methionyl-tRNA synthetase
MYVWFDALTNYVTALGYSEDEKLLKKYWPADAHIIGKEINRFHSLLWPAMLMSAGLELPKTIAVHGWMTVDGQKMSKSIGNVINPLEIITRYPLESVRYFLMREIPFDNDGDYSDAKFKERFNADLANGLGNLTNRVLSMVVKYCDGKVPQVEEKNDELIKYLSDEIWPTYNKFMDVWRFDRALETVSKFITHCDQMISDQKPWSLAKEGKMTEVSDLLYHLCESLRHIAVMIYPVMPETSEKILIQLGLDPAKENAKKLDELQSWVELTVGNKIGELQPLFPRLEK